MIGGWSLNSFGALLILIITLGSYLLSLAGILLRIGCLTRLERLKIPEWVYRLAYTGILLSLLVATLKLGLDCFASYRAELDPAMPFIEIGLLVLETVAFILCLVPLKRYPALVIILAGLLLDVSSGLGLMWLGSLPHDVPYWNLAAWFLIFFGLQRLSRDVLTESIAQSKVPLWVQFRHAKPQPFEDVR